MTTDQWLLLFILLGVLAIVFELGVVITNQVALIDEMRERK